MVPSYPIALASGTAAGSALTNTLTQTSILHASGIGAVPGGMLQVGSIIRAKIRGIISTAASAPGTITFSLVIGAATASNLTATPTLQVSAVNVTFEVEIEAVVRSVGTGTAATIVATARAIGSAAFAAAPGLIMLPASGAPTAGTGFDSTISNKIDVQAAWSVANASNSITVHSSLIEVFQ